LLLQASADFGQREALAAHPVENLLHDTGLLEHDIIARHSAALGLAHKAIAEGRCRQSVDTTLTCRVELATATAFQKEEKGTQLFFLDARRAAA